MESKDNIVLMKFGATWCKPCAVLNQTIDKLIEKYPHLDSAIQVFDADASPEVFKEFMIRNVPTLIMVKNGEQLKSITGAMSLSALEIFAEELLIA